MRRISIDNLAAVHNNKYTYYADTTVLKTWMFETGKTAYEEEQRIIRKYKEYKYTGNFVLLTGNSELFTKDILELDNER